MIHETADGYYVISSRGRWLPGVYDSQRAARYAFRFADEDLAAVNAERGVGEEYRLITFEDLQTRRRGGAP